MKPLRRSGQTLPGDAVDLRVSAQTVQAKAALKLREAITSGIFQPGDRLVESEMCSRLGISRPSLREALRSLEAERLVEIIPNKGPQIPILTLAEAQEIYDVRAILEGEAAALFTSRATAAALGLMKKALIAFDAATKQEDLAGQIETTRRFYEPMLVGCGNRIILEMLNTLTARITFLRSKSMSQPGRAQKSGREMKEILKAIAAGDADAARAAAVEHVWQACHAATKNFLEGRTKKRTWNSRKAKNSSARP
jgi:DNA-binding GntR family transcriptional regulator